MYVCIYVSMYLFNVRFNLEWYYLGIYGKYSEMYSVMSMITCEV